MAINQIHRLIEEAQQLPLPDLKILLERIREEIEEREWDEKWDETLASPESVAYQERAYERIQQSVANGEKWLTLDDLEKLVDADEIGEQP